MKKLLCLLIFLTLTIAAKSQLTNNLVSYWTFNETANDVTGNNNGTVIGASSSPSGKMGSCYSFDGVNDYIECINNPTINITGAISLSAWIKTSSTSPQLIICKPPSSNSHINPWVVYGLSVAIVNGTFLSAMSVTINGTKTSSKSDAITTNAWHHIVGVFNQNNLLIYIDGSLQRTEALTGNISTYATPLRIGTNGGYTECFMGLIDEVGLWNRALTAAEVASLYNAGSGLPYSSFGGTTVPTAPSGLTATATSCSQINLSWTENATNEQGFAIERSTVSGSGYALIYSTGSNLTSYSDSGLNSSQTYYYRIRAFNGQMYSAYTSEQQATTLAEGGVPAIIGYNQIFSDLSSSSNRRAQPVTMTENGTINDITIYHAGGTGNILVGIYSNASGFPNQRIAVSQPTPVNSSAGWQTINLISPISVSQGVTIWLAWVFENSQTVRYQSGTPGRAWSDSYYVSGMPVTFGTSTLGNSIYSVYANYFASTPVLAPTLAPSALTANAVSSSQINLSWTDNSSNETGFKIYISGGTLVTTISTANTTTYSVTGVNASTSYSYYILAYNGAGNSSNSNTASATTPACSTGSWQTSGSNIYYSSGKVSIGTSITNTASALSVNGKILATEVEVVSSITADYVFKPEYQLMPITELEIYLKTNRHLPGVPSAEEFSKNGQNLGRTDDLLLRKIEELTLYIIEQNKSMIEQNKTIEALKKEVEALKENSK